MRRDGLRSELSRGAVAAVIAGAVLLHAAGLWWVLQQRFVEGDAAEIRSLAMYAFFVRPSAREPVPIAPVPRVPPAPQRVAASAKAVSPRVPVVVPASVAAMPAIASEPPVDAPTAFAPRIERVAEPPATPAESILVARPDHGQCPPPAYPMLLREQGIEGVVMLRVRVDVLGRAAEVHLLRPSGWRLFDEAALQQVRACRFVPARRGGEALASWVEFPVRFALAG